MLEHFQDLQIRPQSQRLQILELLNDLMLQHRQALKELGEEFIVGVTDLVSGDKDPRNLMIIFSVLKAVMIEWDISNYAEVCLPIGLLENTLISCRHCSTLYFATSQSPFDHHQMTRTESLRRTSKNASVTALLPQVSSRLSHFPSSLTSLTQHRQTSKSVNHIYLEDSL